jgi:hypothetical protein
VVDFAFEGPDGRVIILSDERWEHVIDGHPELSAWRARVVEIAMRPERSMDGRRADEQWFYGEGGPSRWIKVVVQWDGSRGFVVTAFARRRLP